METRPIVLVVDDDADWRTRTAAAVTACGLVPILAADDYEAEDLLDQATFDLVITDNRMCFADSGIDLLIREWLLARAVPSILHTSELSRVQRARLEKEEKHLQVTVVLKSYTDRAPLFDAIRRLLPAPE